jgi:hypothetical protein
MVAYQDSRAGGREVFGARKLPAPDPDLQIDRYRMIEEVL